MKIAAAPARPAATRCRARPSLPWLAIKRLPGFVPFLALALVPLLAACSSGTDAAKPADTTSTTRSPRARGNVDGALTLGQLAPLSGSLAPIAKSLTTPVEIAVNQINAAGGISGKPVKLTIADDGGGENGPVATASLAMLLDAKKVDAVIGPTATGTALDLLDTIRTRGVLTCSGSNSAEELSHADSGGYYFRTAPPDRLQAIALARLVATAGRQHPVIVARDDAYGRAFLGPLGRELRRRGVKPVGSFTYDAQVPNLDAVGRQIARRHPDSVVVIALAEDGARIVSAMAAAGVGPNQVPVYTADGMQSATFHTKVDPANPGAVRGIVGTAPAAAPASGENAFTAAMRQAGVEPVFSAYYYDCAMLTALAAVQAHSDDPAKMKRAFAKSLEGNSDCSTFGACVALLAAGKTIHYRGAANAFDRGGGPAPAPGSSDVWWVPPGGAGVAGPPAQQIHVP